MGDIVVLTKGGPMRVFEFRKGEIWGFGETQIVTETVLDLDGIVYCQETASTIGDCSRGWRIHLSGNYTLNVTEEAFRRVIAAWRAN